MRNKLLKNFLLLIFMIGFWFLIYRIVNRPIIPSPLLVLERFVKIFFSKLLLHISYSIFRIMMSIFFAVLIGFPLGIFIGYYKKIDELLSPIITCIYPIPKIALLPIIMLVFGLGEVSKILTMFMVIVFQIIISIKDTVKAFDETIYYPLIVLNASEKEIFTNILIPASLPRLFSSIRIALATSLSILFFSETFGTTKGLGFFIMDSMLRVNYLDMYSGIIALSLIGSIFFYVADILENKFKY